jgi:hypothetical protein
MANCGRPFLIRARHWSIRRNPAAGTYRGKPPFWNRSLAVRRIFYEPRNQPTGNIASQWRATRVPRVCRSRSVPLLVAGASLLRVVKPELGAWGSKGTGRQPDSGPESAEGSSPNRCKPAAPSIGSGSVKKRWKPAGASQSCERTSDLRPLLSV